MILDFQYWWKQFNGPRVTAIMKAIRNWMAEKWDEKITYFWNLSVETANSSHLTIFGVLSGFIRAVISAVDEDFFYFTHAPSTPGSSHGFSYRPGTSYNDGPDPYEWGGQFNEIDSSISALTLIPTEWYRLMLLTWAMTTGQDRSLKLLDDLTYALAYYDSPEQSPYYTFYWYTSSQSTTSKTYGDIDLELDTVARWKHPFIAIAIFTRLAETMYAPVPRLFPILEGMEETYIVKGLLQFLSQDDLYIAQVYQDTPYTLLDFDIPDPGTGMKWNTMKDGTGTDITAGYELNAEGGIVYAYPVPI